MTSCPPSPVGIGLTDLPKIGRPRLPTANPQLEMLSQYLSLFVTLESKIKQGPLKLLQFYWPVAVCLILMAIISILGFKLVQNIAVEKDTDYSEMINLTNNDA